MNIKDIFTLSIIIGSALLTVAIIMNLHDNYEYNKISRSLESEKLEKWEIYFRQQHNK